VRAAILAALVAALGGCPLPQPLAEVPRDGSVVAPPTILTETARPPDVVVAFRPDCDVVQPFSVSVLDANVEERVDVRWFVNYSTTNFGIADDETIDGTFDLSRTVRAITPFTLFRPSTFAAAGTHHVVEVVVSNGFSPDPNATPTNRSPLPGFSTQVYRWFVVLDPAGGCPGT
jgi:hypothetical protein